MYDDASEDHVNDFDCNCQTNYLEFVMSLKVT